MREPMNSLFKVTAHFCRCMLHLWLLFLVFFVWCGRLMGQSTTEAAGTSSAAAAAETRPKSPGWSTLVPRDAKGTSPHLSLPQGPPADVANRRVLESRAGRNAGKLLLRSVPSNAQVWIDGAFVGSSPLLLLLAPGKYQVELRGTRMEYTARAIDLLPGETREIVLVLALRYPTRAFVR